MAVMKCKMCGGDLNVTEDVSVVECEYCGSRQTIPSQDSEKKLTLFARADRLRRACEFDKAAGVYESIVAEFPQEAEAYWGLVLCRYGIEYVDDPATGKKVPTCHRSSFDSILEDADFDQACENADAIARRQYREEAKVIEDIRKGILEVSGKEEPYDIFICYKETDENGGRTIDSVIAQDVYDALTEKGYRVFFSRISLEDKLGSEYEPYIFAALNSAKVMLAFGTDYEYFNAVWVKNEWSRFLALMAAGQKKTLIPCYKNLDAYDMPKEFQRLQAQDMGKVGAIQDLLRGIDKITGRTAAPAASVSAPAAPAPQSALTERGMLFLEDGNWAKANEYFERALDANPKDGQAYLGKVLAAERVTGLEELKKKDIDLEKSRDFSRALQFSAGSQRKALEDMAEAIQRRMLGKRLVDQLVGCKMRITAYDTFSKLLEEALEAPDDRSSIARFESLGAEFAKLKNYKDSMQKRKECLKQLQRLQRLRAAEKQRLAEEMARAEKERQEAEVRRAEQDARVREIERRQKLPFLAEKRKKLLPAAGLIRGTESQTVGLKADGTVVAVGWNIAGQCDAGGWTDIVAVAAGGYHTVGLKADGTVVAVGYNEYGQCAVSGWTGIVAVVAEEYHTIGLKSDGTVVAVGKNADGQCDVSGWKLFNSFETLEQERAAARQAKIAALNMEKQSLQAELANLKGLFTGKRRKEIEARLAQIEEELKKL